ncbi:MAG: AzlD domain-containing protein [Thermoleophilia bacterium]
MSWAAILALALGTYALKAAGPVLLGGRPLPTPVARVADLLPAALLAALVVTQAFASGRELTIDARAAGLAAAAATACWRPRAFLAIVAAGVAGAIAARLTGA